MSIPIPYAMDYTSTMSGAVLKFVHCEQCGTEYVYQLDRTATGEGTSFLFLDNSGASARATSEAEEALRRKLERGVDLVPCLSCGWYQQHMLAKARKQHRRWMLDTGACLTVGVIPVALIGGIFNVSQQGTPMIPWPIFLAGVIGLAVLGIGLMVGKFILARGYDPNSQDVEIRKQLGQEKAMLRGEFERMVKAQQGGDAVLEEKATQEGEHSGI